MIHAAAERRTDVVERDPQTVQNLNVGATAVIASVCGEISSSINSTSSIFQISYQLTSSCRSTMVIDLWFVIHCEVIYT